MTTHSSNPTLAKTLSKAEFEAVAEHCFAAASQAVAKRQRVQSLLLLGRIRDGVVQIGEVMSVPVNRPEDREMLAALMETIVQRPTLDFVVHVTEAWLLLNPTSLPTKSIANHPKRQEAVTFNILSKDCQIVVINRLHRNPSRLERGEVNFEMQIAGRMVRETPPPN